MGYYAHLGWGGARLVGGGKKVERLLERSDTPVELRERLETAGELLAFAESELVLPAGKKYRKYLDLGRPFVVWNVVAAPELSLAPEIWCFPIAGCVSYRGYFSPKKANAFGKKMEERGFDVSVGGVRAFSSLGWLKDRLLNTFLFSEDVALAEILFHELAHSVVYVQDDTSFNESFATFVERVGVETWLGREVASDSLRSARERWAEEDEIRDVLNRYRGEMSVLYESTSDREEKLRLKDETFARLQTELAEVAGEGDAPVTSWSRWRLNNADLAASGAYNEWVPAFERLFKRNDREFGSFYDSVRCLAELEIDQRRLMLERREWDPCILTRYSGPPT